MSTTHSTDMSEANFPTTVLPKKPTAIQTGNGAEEIPILDRLVRRGDEEKSAFLHGLLEMSRESKYCDIISSLVAHGGGFWSRSVTTGRY